MKSLSKSSPKKVSTAMLMLLLSMNVVLATNDSIATEEVTQAFSIVKLIVIAALVLAAAICALIGIIKLFTGGFIRKFRAMACIKASVILLIIALCINIAFKMILKYKGKLWQKKHSISAKIVGRLLPVGWGNAQNVANGIATLKKSVKSIRVSCSKKQRRLN